MYRVSGKPQWSFNGSSYDMSMMTYAAGPKVMLPVGRSTVFFHGLGGVAKVKVVPGGNGHWYAIVAGGGLDIPISRSLDVRVAQIDWMKNGYPRNGITNMNYSAGMTFRF